MIACVVVDVLNNNVDKVFDYTFSESLNVEKGDKVVVPFASRITTGYVVDILDKATILDIKLKSVIKISEKQILTDENIELMWFMKEKYHVKLIDALRLFVPSGVRNNTAKKKEIEYVSLNVSSIDEALKVIKKNAHSQIDLINYLFEEEDRHEKTLLNNMFSSATVNALIKKGLLKVEKEEKQRVPYNDMENTKKEQVELNFYQENAVKKIISKKGKTFLLFGVTGSGKTEVYMKVIENCLNQGKTAIMLVPEIALTPQMLKVFRNRFSSLVALLHSGLTDGERFDEWWKIKSGVSKIVVGARSAIFAPIENVDAIIIDEQHDNSYISESNPRYKTEEVASFRAKYNNANLILGSATPSIETFKRAEDKEIELITLPERVNSRELPFMDIVDMKKETKLGNYGIFSSHLLEKLKETIESGGQAMLFINRRGYFTKFICKECGYIAKCKDCDVSLTYHSDENVLKCHYCKNKYRMPRVCPKCKSTHILTSGVGTEKVVEELKKHFKDVGILRMDFDTTKNKLGHYNILKDFADKKAQILVGTQMIAKGHDFPEVSLVGIINADLSLSFTDYRASEMTFQLITQVAGRAGRAEKEGTVVLQTYNPDNYIFKLSSDYDYESFYEREIALREVCKFPPFASIVRVIVSSEIKENAERVLNKIYNAMLKLKADNEDKFYFLDRRNCPIKRIQKKFRYEIIAKLSNEKSNQDIIEEIYNINDREREDGVSSFVEINPINMN